MKMKNIALGINVDHIATLRQARGGVEPNPITAALLAVEAGANSITVHLREDRRHIQDHDVIELKQRLTVPLNLEMAVTEEMMAFAMEYLPEKVCLVPEKRRELTTEGGLDVIKQRNVLSKAVEKLQKHNVAVSFFLDPDLQQIEQAIGLGVDAIELHTGAYAEAKTVSNQTHELNRLIEAAKVIDNHGVIVHAGHGLNYNNVLDIVAINEIVELNIGHSIICRAVFVGIHQAVTEMKYLCESRKVE